MSFLFISCSGNAATADASTVDQNRDSLNVSDSRVEKTNTSNGNSNAGELLIGSWLVINVVGEHKDLNMGLIFTWTKDGKMSMEREFYIEGTYILKDGAIVWTTKDFELTYDFTISG